MNDESHHFKESLQRPGRKTPLPKENRRKERKKAGKRARLE
jgi:hypothetical protein